MNRTRMFSAFACALLALSATASAARAQRFRARVGLLGFAGPIALDDAFKGFDIPVTTRDSAGGVMGNVAYRRTRTFAKAQASTYLNCGAGMTGPNADEMRLTIAILAIVDPGPDGGTKLRLGMAATAEDIIGQSKPAIGCATSGRLESAIAEFVKKRADGLGR